jgi:hypothetical protein
MDEFHEKIEEDMFVGLLLSGKEFHSFLLALITSYALASRSAGELVCVWGRGVGHIPVKDPGPCRAYAIVL